MNVTYKMNTYQYIYLIHALLVGPLLIYTSTRLNSDRDDVLKKILMVLGFGVIGYHAYLLQKIDD